MPIADATPCAAHTTGSTDRRRRWVRRGRMTRGRRPCPVLPSAPGLLDSVSPGRHPSQRPTGLLRGCQVASCPATFGPAGEHPSGGDSAGRRRGAQPARRAPGRRAPTRWAPRPHTGGEGAKRRDQLGRVADREVDPQHAEVGSQRFHAIGPGLEHARRVVDRRDRPQPGTEPLREHGGRCPDDDPRRVTPSRRGDASRDHRLHLRIGQLERAEPRPGRHARADPIDPERAPVLAVVVPGDEVPALAGIDDPVRLDPPLRDGVPAIRVVEPQPQALAAQPGELGEHRRIDGRAAPPPDVDGDLLEGADLAPKPGRQHLLQLRQRAQRRLLDPGHRPTGRGAQADRDRHRLLVVEQQRRHGRPGLQAIAPDRAARGVDRIAQRAQPLDVVADGPRADLEPAGELGTRPVTRGLEQRQQPQEA